MVINKEWITVIIMVCRNKDKLLMALLQHNKYSILEMYKIQLAEWKRREGERLKSRDRVWGGAFFLFI